ncbi:hypothetical protein F1654_02945 [Alkalicaulis satelles]|uniref:Cytochrome c n=1 Tax=Alkalicaulis satelles TaxID=2609175 RepID=A0A5M6ZMQ5_9PROT|nr:hypothetical protein [Alkalicaulis satelles]KAA5804967.1 hypothetical protein F1654_02945 [Alkalicaulis satelles]
MTHLRLTALTASLLLIAACNETGTEPPAETGPNDWLHNQAGDTERFARLQSQLGGFSQSMWEVGERYERMHEAISRENFELALYHWDKIGDATARGIERRPGRAANARAMFLDSEHGEVRELLEERTLASAWAGFERAHYSCQSCHEAEDAAFFNDQPVFDLRAPEDYRD